jgi:hypothetical protein
MWTNSCDDGSMLCEYSYKVCMSDVGCDWCISTAVDGTTAPGCSTVELGWFPPSCRNRYPSRMCVSRSPIGTVSLTFLNGSAGTVCNSLVAGCLGHRTGCVPKDVGREDLPYKWTTARPPDSHPSGKWLLQVRHYKVYT